MWWRVVIGALVLPFGCNRVFGFDRGPDVDAVTCWDPLQMAHDEDGDGFADGCDVCPADADPAQPDDDLDGVGDACDPHRGMPRDHLVFFDSFETANPAWTSFEAGVSWQIANGGATQALKGNGYLILKNRTFRDPTVITYFRGQGAGTTATPSFAGAYTVITDDTHSPPLGMVGDMEGTDAGMFVQVSRPPSNLPADFVTRMIAPGSRARIAVSARGECFGRYDDGLNVVAALPTLGPALDGEVGLRTTNTSATFDSVTVIETDP